MRTRVLGLAACLVGVCLALSGCSLMGDSATAPPAAMVTMSSTVPASTASSLPSETLPPTSLTTSSSASTTVTSTSEQEALPGAVAAITDGDQAQDVEEGIQDGSSSSPLKIVTIHYDAQGNDNNNLNEEYVIFEVLATVSLKGYAVEDEFGHRYDFTDTVFTEGQTITLHTGEGTDAQADLYWGATGTAIWNNDGDTVNVLDSTGDIVVSQSYS